MNPLKRYHPPKQKKQKPTIANSWNRDAYTQQAHSDGYRARSAYKLLEVQERYHVMRAGNTVLDIGCAPGSWLQVAAEIVGERGCVLGIDLQETKPVADNVVTTVGDALDVAAVQAWLASMGFNRVDAVLADLAPATTGIKDVDRARSAELTAAVLQVALAVGRPGCKVVSKIFIGPHYEQLVKDAKLQFAEVKTCKPKAVRGTSEEVYIIARKHN